MADQFSVDDRAVPNRLAQARWLRWSINALVLGAWGVFLAGQLGALRQHSWQVAPAAIGLAVGLGALYFAGLALSWALLLRKMAGPAVALDDAGRVWLRSMLTRYVPGNVWHILSRMAYAGRLGVDRSQILSSATIEQALTLLGALALFGLTLPLWGPAQPLQAWLALLVPLGLLLVHPLALGRALGWAARLARRPALAWRYRYRDMLLLLLAYGGANLCAGLALAALLWGMTPLAIEQLPLIVGASALAWSAGYLSLLTPSGLGVREAALTALLAQVYPLPVALVAGLLLRVALTAGELLAVLGALAGERPRNDER